MKTNLKLIPISADEMIDHKDGEYNISIWNSRVKGLMSSMKDVKFYYVDMY